MQRLFIIFLCLLSESLWAQNASDVVPVDKELKDTTRQTDLIDVARSVFHFKSQKTRKQGEKKIYFSILPVSTAVPGGSGKALITSTTAGTYLGPRATTSISSASFTPYWNFNNRVGLPLRTSIWFPDNSWTMQGDTRFLVYPQYTWGLGSNSNRDNETLVDYKYIRFYQSALKRIKSYFFAGAGYNLDYHFNIKSDDPNVDLASYTHYPYGTSGSSVSSGFSLDLLYDTRNNSINPLPGSYINLVYRVNSIFFGSNENWQSLYVDIRKYVPLNPAKPNQQNTLAFWSYLWTVFDGKAPYLDLPSIGWDPYNTSGRGIDQNRYRGKTLFYAESEYRRDITQNGLLGFVLFVNANSVSGSGTLFSSWHPAGGVGLRIKFNKGSNTNIDMDYGLSRGYRSVMFSLGEAF